MKEWTKKDSALASATSAENLAEVQRLLEDNEPPRKAAITRALSAAVSCRNIEIVSLLLSRSAEIREPTITSATTSKALTPMLELLLEHGWDINGLGVAILRYAGRDGGFQAPPTSPNGSSQVLPER